MRKSIWSSFFLLWCFSTSLLNAQSSGSSGVNLSVETGKIIMHSEEFHFVNRGINSMIRLQYEAQLDSSTYWARHYGYPRVAIELNYARFANRDILGENFGLLSIIKLPIYRFKRSSIEFSIGTGVSYSNKPYDSEKNPLNMAIGTHINNQTHFGMSYLYNIAEYRGLEAGVSFWHNSNGSIQKPNKGLNFYHFRLGFKNHFLDKPFIKDKRKVHRIQESAFQVEINSSLALHKTRERWTPRYIVSSHELMLKSRVVPFTFVTLALMSELNTANVEYFLNVQEEYNRKNARQRARRIGLSAGAETLFGKIGLGVQMGYYLKGEIKPGPIYNKTYLRYYFLGRSQWEPKAHIGVVLKSHALAAEYIAVRIGITFKK